MSLKYIENVSKLDAASILHDEVFDELFEISTERERARKLIELQDKAKTLGVKSKFDDIYKSALRDFKERQRELKQELANAPTSYVTEFSGEPVLASGAWIANDNGIYANSRDGMVLACSHPIYPTGILVNAETGDHKLILRYKVRGRWRETIENRDVVASSNKIISLANKGVMVTSENARALVKYLADVEALNNDVVAEHTSTSRLGWIKDNFMPYDEEVVFDNEQSLRPLFNSIRTCGSRAKWFDHVKALRQKRRIEIQMYMGASLASVLVEPCGALPFIISLWGDSGLGKTLSLKLATSIWADPEDGSYITDAKATNVAMEIRLDCLNSLPMMLDDMAQIKNQYDGDFSELVYRWCAGKGRDRSNKDLGLNRLTSWRNCTLTNGERSLVTESMQGGAVNRIIEVPIESEIFDNGNTTTKILKNNFGFLGREFVDIVQNVGFDEINKRFETKAKMLRELSKQKGVEKEEKQIVPMALILLADEIATTECFKDDVFIDPERCLDLLKSKGDISEHERAYEYLCDTIVSYRFHFADNIDESVADRIDEWGFFGDGGKIYIVGTRFDEIMAKGNFQSKAFLVWAKKHNLIDAGEGTHLKKRIRRNGMNARYVVIKIEEKPDFMGVSELDEIPFD